MSLLLELIVAKDKVSSLHSQAGRDKEAMEEDYICCALKPNIYGDQPEVLDGVLNSVDPLPIEFFVNPSYPVSQQ